MSTPDFDYSREAFESVLGTEVMARIRKSATEAAPPTAEQVERIRAIFTSALAQLARPEEVRAA